MSLTSKITKWIKSNQLEFILLVLVLAVAIFLRFYLLSDYMTFLGDEGRDALVIKRILVDHHIPLLGPTMSVGNIYLGPLYYYMMAVSMGIFWLNPIAAAGMNALIGVLTVVLIYYLARVWFGKYPALVASFGYATSPVTVFYSRSSWNPNPGPFFSLLAVLGFYKARQTKNYLWLILTGGALAFAVQMHYLNLILIPFFIIIWVYELIRNKKSFRNFFSGTILAILAFLLLMSPLVLFDLRHDLMNYRAITAFFFNKDSNAHFNLIDFISRIYAIYTQKLIGRYLTLDSNVGFLISILTLIPIGNFLFDLVKNKKVKWELFLVTSWLFVGLIFIALLNLPIFDHYLNFINPIPYLLIATLLSLLNLRFQVILASVLILLFLLTNIPKNILFTSPNKQLYRTQEIAKYVIEASADKPFNFALIAERNYDSAYQFYLDIYGHKPKVVPVDITDQLFVVCEDKVCNPINHPKYEIAGFGYAKVASVNKILGVEIFKLVSNPSGKP